MNRQSLKSRLCKVRERADWLLRFLIKILRINWWFISRFTLLNSTNTLHSTKVNSERNYLFSGCAESLELIHSFVNETFFKLFNIPNRDNNFAFLTFSLLYNLHRLGRRIYALFALSTRSTASGIFYLQIISRMNVDGEYGDNNRKE